MTSWSRYQIRFVCSFLLAAVLPRPAAAQEEAIVESLAGILAACDARRFTGPLFRAAARHPEPIVRHHAALAMGRIGNPSATPILLRMTSDPDSVVQRYAVFAIGLLAPPEALGRMRDLVLNTPAEEQGSQHAEAVTAAARIGGPDGAAVITEVLNRWVGLSGTRMLPVVVRRALAESWRLGPHAPIPVIRQFADAADPQVRWRAVYALAALQAPSASNALLRAVADNDPLVRALAAGALTAEYADGSGLDRRGLAARVRGLVNDPDPQVRIQALRALATYESPSDISLAADRTADIDANVRVEALAALGRMQGEDAAAALSRRLEGGIFATRRQALLSLVRVSGESALEAIAEWMARSDWLERATAAAALTHVNPRAARPYVDRLLTDEDERVVAAALHVALGAHAPAADSLARRYVSHRDPVLRRMAAHHLGATGEVGDVALLADAYELSLGDRGSEARTAIVVALGRIAARGRAGDAIQSHFLVRFPTADDHLVRRAAEQWLPAAADRWGSARPIETGKGIQDYRDLAREVVLPAERGESRNEVVVETDRGDLLLELFAAGAPFTVQAFNRLIDRRYFDGLAWYRVDPGAQAESGDRRGDGLAGDGQTIRDEQGPRAFGRGAVGLVLDGPDTGESRFFIVQSPQLGFQGTHTVFARVVSGLEVLDRLTLGDRIRRVRRQ